MADLAKTGITENTPKNIVFGAGTIYRDLKFETNKFTGTIIGATQGGSKFTITPEITDIEADGALVKTKGLTVKTGETASMEVNFLEVTPEILKMTTLGKENSSTSATGFTEIVSKASIEAGDYVAGLAFVGRTLDGKQIIVTFDNALCTSGLELEGKNKENGVVKATFECYADLTGNLETLPYHIYYPTVAG